MSKGRSESYGIRGRQALKLAHIALKLREPLDTPFQRGKPYPTVAAPGITLFQTPARALPDLRHVLSTLSERFSLRAGLGATPPAGNFSS